MTADDLVTVHDRAYVDAVRTGEPAALAESNGLSWDAGLFATTCASTGGAVAAALRALETGTAGSLSSGLHHAKRSRGDGFCTFNGLALAARRALDAGARGVLIVDLDAHCGGGTAELLADDPRIAQVDLAVDAFDWYRERGRFTLDTIVDASAYLPTLRRRLDALDPAGFDLVLYNAGMDPFEGCLIGGRRGMTRDLLAEREDDGLRLVPRRRPPGGVRPGRRLRQRRVQHGPARRPAPAHPRGRGRACLSRFAVPSMSAAYRWDDDRRLRTSASGRC